MKNGLLICVFLAFTSCAVPRFRYNFGRPLPESSGRSATDVPVDPPSSTETALHPAESIELTAGIAEPSPTVRVKRAYPKPLRRHEVPAAQVRTSPPPALPGNLDADLKRSAIFFAGGAVALIIGGDVFVVAGSLALLIGLIFGIKWLLRE